MYSLFVPKVKFENMNPEYFMNWSLQTKEQCFSFSLWSSAGKEWVKVCYPFDDDSDEFFKNAEPVLYYRSFLRGSEERPYSLEFSHVLHTDVVDCYGSLYTHSISWAIHGLEEAKRNKRNNSKRNHPNFSKTRMG